MAGFPVKDVMMSAANIGLLHQFLADLQQFLAVRGAGFRIAHKLGSTMPACEN